MGAMSLAGLGFVAILLLFVFGVIIGGFFIWIAAKIARVEKATFGKAMLAAVASSFVSSIIMVLTRMLPVIGDVLGFIVGLIISILIIKGIFDTSFSKAIVVDFPAHSRGYSRFARIDDRCFGRFLVLMSRHGLSNRKPPDDSREGSR